MSIFNQMWQCTGCGWIGHEDDLESKCTFHQTQEEPAEYEAWCPQCGADWDQFTEITQEQES
jgi:rubredoxin